MSKSQYLKTWLSKFLTLLPFIFFIFIGVPVSGMALNEAMKIIGLKTVPVPVIGTGSMYPSLFWSTEEGGPEDESKKLVEEYRTTPMMYKKYAGFNFFGQIFLDSHIKYGDMIAFKNTQTEKILSEDGKDKQAGFIKRVIGMPGDIIELRDGFVYKNNSLLAEPYILAPKSTYGGSTFKDCFKIEVPSNQYFVLGDNRKVSSDSRYDLGFVADSDIEFVLPYEKQTIYERLWRDPSKDGELLGEPSMSSLDFVTLLNQVRTSKGLSKLTLKSSLNQSSKLRAEALLSKRQTSLDLKQSTSKSGYTNILLGEFVTYGAYSAKELVENLTYNQKSASQVLDKNYSDIGISALNQEVNGCPTQIVVGHLGGYVPATYDETTVSSWRDLHTNLKLALPSWERAQDNSDVDQTKLKELLAILHRRQVLVTEVLAVFEKREWISDDLKSRMDKDLTDATVAEKIIDDINGQ